MEPAIGTAGVVGPDATPVPAALVALTVNVYVVRFDRPVTMHVSGPAVVQVLPPGALVTV